MTSVIEKYIKENNINEALSECLRENKYHLGLLLCKIYQDEVINDSKFHSLYSKIIDAVNSLETDCKEIIEIGDLIDKFNPVFMEQGPKIEEKKYRVMLLCNWCTSKELTDIWNKMSKGNYTWNNIELVYEEPVDYYVVINCPPITVFPDPKKTILFQMEPNMSKSKHLWGEWAEPNKKLFKFCGVHEDHYNNSEWHLGKTYTQLCNDTINKNPSLDTVISGVLSDKYADPGHKLRVDFAKFLEKKGVETHVYGGNKFEWVNYKGTLPYHNKDDAILPYKYVFNAENNAIPNYFTEKLLDGILGESLVFYWGCPNIYDFIDKRAFVKLDLLDFEKDYEIIEKAIRENWWEQRLPYIKDAKKKILNELQFFPRLERILVADNE